MLRTKENGFLVGAFDLNAVRLDGGIILQRVMYDASVKRVQWFEFHDVTPPANLLGRFLRFLDKRISLLGTVIAYVQRHFRTFGIFLKNEPIGDVLQFAQCLALATDQPSRIVRLNIEENLAFDVVVVHRRFESKTRQELFKDCFWVCCHN